MSPFGTKINIAVNGAVKLSAIRESCQKSSGWGGCQKPSGHAQTRSILNRNVGIALTMRSRQIAGYFLGTIEFVASMLYILEKLGISVVLPPLPSSGLMFDILLVLAIIGAVGFPVWIGYQIRGWRSKKVEKESVKVHVGRPFGVARIDPRYEHVQVHVFWPLHHSIPLLSQWLGHTHDIITENDLPKVKYVINYKTRNAFSVGSYAWELLLPFKRIEINSETKWFPFYSDLWLRRHGFRWSGRAATPTDFLEEPYLSESNQRPQIPPEIVVKINPPFVCDPKHLAYLLRKEVEGLQVYRVQCLTVKATTTNIESLMAKTSIDGVGPYFLNWAPKASEPASENPKRIDLVREEEAQLPIWYAAKQLVGPEKGFRFLLIIPSDDRVFEYELDGLEKLTISVEVQFIAKNIEPKAQQFTLEVKPWDELCLSEKR